MVFNRFGRLLKESLLFKLGETKIPSTREYCYLGVTFSLTGALKVAQESGSVQTLRCSDRPRSLLRKSSLDAEHSCLIKSYLLYTSQTSPLQQHIRIFRKKQPTPSKGYISPSSNGLLESATTLRTQPSRVKGSPSHDHFAD